MATKRLLEGKAGTLAFDLCVQNPSSSFLGRALGWHGSAMLPKATAPALLEVIIFPLQITIAETMNVGGGRRETL